MVFDGIRATFPGCPPTLRCAVCFGHNLSQMVKIAPEIHCPCKALGIGKCLCPLRLHPFPRSKSVKMGLPGMGGSKGGWRIPFTP